MLEKSLRLVKLFGVPKGMPLVATGDQIDLSKVAKYENENEPG